MNPLQLLGTILLCVTSAYLQEGPSSVSAYALRLGPGEEILTSLSKFVQEKRLKAPFVMTCVGSVTKATLRLANSDALNTNEIIHLSERLEIVSLVGTLNEHAHLHISLSDKDGKTIGGHAIGDLHVFTTAEIVIGDLGNLEFTREMDERTGFPELVIRPRSANEIVHQWNNNFSLADSETRHHKVTVVLYRGGMHSALAAMELNVRKLILVTNDHT